jgi:hypothetical protein
MVALVAMKASYAAFLADLDFLVNVTADCWIQHHL